MRRVMCLHMPYLPTDRARRDEPPPSDEAAAVLVLTRRVASTVLVERGCPHAERLGVKAGITLGHARAMSPGLVALPHEPHRDRALLHQLAGWALRFSPVVEPVEPDTLLVDVTGCARLFRGETNIARQAVEGLRRQGLQARAAIADTVGAACALASAGQDRVRIIPPGQNSAYLAGLPPLALRIDPMVAERLDALGIRSVGDLLMLSRPALAARFGPDLLRRLQQALGETHEGVTGHVPAEVLQAWFEFEGPVSEPAAVRTIAGQLLRDVFAQAERRSVALRQVDCVLYYEHVPPAVIALGFSRPSRSAEHALELLGGRLESADVSPGVVGLRIVAAQTSRWHPSQGELFESRSPGDDEALACLVDRIANRLGYAAIVRPRLEDDHQPEMAFRYVSVAEAGCVAEEKAAPSAERITSAARPLRLHERPLLIRVIAVVPDGPPTWFALRGGEQRVLHAWGPERLETAWWRGPDQRRDYFRVCVETGEHYWIYRDLSQGRWYLHGEFA